MPPNHAPNIILCLSYPSHTTFTHHVDKNNNNNMNETFSEGISYIKKFITNSTLISDLKISQVSSRLANH